MNSPDTSTKKVFVIAGLCGISMATILAEICLTKLISYKLYHHYTYVIISLVMFSFGLAGVTGFMRPDRFGADRSEHWFFAGNSLLNFAWLLLVSIPIYCLLPLESTLNIMPWWTRAITFPTCLLLFAVPFYAAGVGISHTFAAARISVRTLYFWDLIAAAAGAACTPFLLEHLGGYGTIFTASLLGLGSAFAFYRAAAIKINKTIIGQCAVWLVAAIAFSAYPALAIKNLGFDILSYKDPRLGALFNNYGGLARTYWNAIARIDLSYTSNKCNNSLLTWGLSPKLDLKDLTGRYMLVDGGASTRQLYLQGPLENSKAIQSALFGTGYVIRPDCKRSMVIGGGGGIDILIGKYWGVPQVDIIEMNPSVFKLLTGTADDPERDMYLPYLKSTDKTRVNVFNEEGRHFCSHTPDQTYDVVQLSGADTLTAISSGGMSLVENYLYTTDALRDYLRMLKPNGVLSITHWRQIPPHCSLRTFNTYLSYLADQGIVDCSKYVMVLGFDYTEILMKTTPFTEAECQRVRDWAQKAGYEMMYDPLVPTKGSPRAEDKIFAELALASPEKRKELVKSYRTDITPVSDDSPYFYRTARTKDDLGTLPVDDSANATFLLLGTAGALLLTLLPLLKFKLTASSRELLPFSVFFAISGFAFLLFETSIIQALGIFVGGPLYSLATVLVAVFTGYALGSMLSQKLGSGPRVMIYSGAVVAAMFLAAFLGLRPLVHNCLAYPWLVRVMISVGLTLALAIPTGMMVPMAAEYVRKRHGVSIAWMWAVNSGFNVLGGLFYVPISQAIGITHTFLIDSILYLVAGIWMGTFMFLEAKRLKDQPLASSHSGDSSSGETGSGGSGSAQIIDS